MRPALVVSAILLALVATLARALPPEVPYLDTIRDAAEMRFGVPAPIPAIVAQIAQESGFDPRAQSRVGAKGLMQFMDGTAEFAAEAGKFGKPNPFDPEWNLRAGIWYDRWLYDRVYYAQECHRWGAALSSYNGGLGWHNRRRASAADPTDFWGSVRMVNPGITAPNQRENQEYPHRILIERQPRYFALGGKRVCH